MKRTRPALLSCLLFLLPACLVDDLDLGGDEHADLEDEIGETSQEVLTANGMSLNGMSLNGMSLNGMSLNGMSLNGMSLNGMSLNGMSLNGVKLTGSQLSGVKGTTTITGTGLVGTKMNGTLSNGGTLVLRIDSATTLPAPNTDVWAYGVSYGLADGTWAPLCGMSGTTKVLAVPVMGTWSYAQGVTGGGSYTPSTTAFTFGCRNTAIAKCVELGYKPWKTVGTTLLRNHHVACTRMIRADYCGDGRSWTTDGTPINLYDALGVQTDAATYPIDAEWLPTGARCIHLARSFVNGAKKPTCYEAKAGQCGGFASGALVISEYKPAITSTVNIHQR